MIEMSLFVDGIEIRLDKVKVVWILTQVSTHDLDYDLGHVRAHYGNHGSPRANAQGDLDRIECFDWRSSSRDSLCDDSSCQRSLVRLVNQNVCC